MAPATGSSEVFPVVKTGKDGPLRLGAQNCVLEGLGRA
jgi:hypothetical protein